MVHYLSDISKDINMNITLPLDDQTRDKQTLEYCGIFDYEHNSFPEECSYIKTHVKQSEFPHNNENLDN